MSKFTKFNKANLKNKNTFWAELVGSPDVFSLESRIFHSITLGLILLVSFYVPYNLYAKLYVGSLSALIFGLFFSYQYYHSRFQGKPHNSVLFGIIGIVLFGINYFTNSGIHGSTDLIWPIQLLLLFAISPYKHHTKWLIVYLLIFSGLHVFEYYNPHWVQHPFTFGKGQFIDRITAFPIPVIVIYLVITFIRRSHDKEQQAGKEKTRAVEISKTQILLQNDQLEQRNVEKNKLMSIISHDLRAPLMNIQNYLSLLNENELSNEERPVLEKALLKSTNSAMDMLSNLLNWSKSQMEGASVNLVEENLLNSLLNTLEMEKALATKKGIQLTHQIPSQITVIADINMLQLVVRNLISNAIKFTPPQGTIHVEAVVLESECKLTVSDNGIGIAKEIQEDIFSIKSKSTLGTNDEKGIGLGLALCKEFIERQGGRIGFESNPGSGSTFFIFIPMPKTTTI
ncbi:sensor histidine kinase [Pedobacter insulae]|uniref:histidine kinase n=1 Tax=Pedobacter insulae TaxID=414048 RepID=A0A1I3AFU2_9SPHI|nr:HAMP domain-containing sensor histidine kinase [Pedobacter insulae]SFH48569.1 Signal transduction histidine kinase [Pedobacter insulae]